MSQFQKRANFHATDEEIISSTSASDAIKRERRVTESYVGIMCFTEDN